MKTKTEIRARIKQIQDERQVKTEEAKKLLCEPGAIPQAMGQIISNQIILDDEAVITLKWVLGEK